MTNKMPKNHTYRYIHDLNQALLDVHQKSNKNIVFASFPAKKFETELGLVKGISKTTLKGKNKFIYCFEKNKDIYKYWDKSDSFFGYFNQFKKEAEKNQINQTYVRGSFSQEFTKWINCIHPDASIGYFIDYCGMATKQNVDNLLCDYPEDSYLAVTFSFSERGKSKSKNIHKDFLSPKKISHKLLNSINKFNKNNKFVLIEQLQYVSSQSPMGLFLFTNSEKIKEAYHKNKNKVTQIKGGMLREEHNLDKIAAATQQTKQDFRVSSMQKYDFTRQQVAATVAWNSKKLKRKMIK